MRRTLVFLGCFLLLAGAFGSFGLYAQREQPQARSDAPIAELRTEIRALRELTDERLKALREMMDERAEQAKLALANADKATQKSEDAQQRVNISQNEFRGALKDQATTLASKEAVDQLEKRIANLEVQAAGGVGRQGGISTTTALIFTLIGLMLGAAGLLARKRAAADPAKTK